MIGAAAFRDSSSLVTVNFRTVCFFAQSQTLSAVVLPNSDGGTRESAASLGPDVGLAKAQVRDAIVDVILAR